MNPNLKVEDEDVYAEAVRELSESKIREGLWAKVLVETDGDRERAKILYLRFRVALIKEERRVAAEERQREESEAAKATESREAAKLEAFFRAYPKAEELFFDQTIRDLAHRYSVGENVEAEIEGAWRKPRRFDIWVWVCLLVFLFSILAYFFHG